MCVFMCLYLSLSVCVCMSLYVNGRMEWDALGNKAIGTTEKLEMYFTNSGIWMMCVRAGLGKRATNITLVRDRVSLTTWKLTVVCWKQSPVKSVLIGPRSPCKVWGRHFLLPHES